MKVRKPSLLIVSHTYAIDSHALKLVALSRHFFVRCVTVSREDAGLPPRPADFDDGPLTELRIELPTLGSVTGNRFLFRGLNRVLGSRDWDYLLVESEPWLPHKWQALALARLSGNVRCYGEFTWENVLREGVKGRLLEPIYRFTARTADFWMAGNKAAAGILESSGMPAERILTYGQVGVETPELSLHRQSKLRDRFQLPQDAFIAGFAGRYVPEKGILDLIQAAKRLHAEGLTDLHLAFMGKGPLESRLQALANEHSWIHLVPAVPYEKVMEHLPLMDLLVLGSHPVRERGRCWEEQFGHILIESMAVGTPTAGSRSGAIPEVIGDDEMLFDVGDVVGIESILRRCLVEPGFHESKRRTQLDRVRSVFSHDEVADVYQRFLTTIEPR